MDALDGLLASLDAERATKSEKQKAQPVSPQTPVRKRPQSRHTKCGIAPAPSIKASTGSFLTGEYDYELVLSTPCTPFDINESQASASVYCPLSPTIMSVHLPGSPLIPQVLELDDTVSSVVMLGERCNKYGPRPCRVRFECRGEPDPEADKKYAPQLPSRRPLGTGKLISR